MITVKDVIEKLQILDPDEVLWNCSQDYFNGEVTVLHFCPKEKALEFEELPRLEIIGYGANSKRSDRSS